jgi:hypothetical protein
MTLPLLLILAKRIGGRRNLSGLGEPLLLGGLLSLRAVTK